MGMPIIALQRMIARRMAVDAAGMLDDLAGFPKQRDRSLVQVLKWTKMPPAGRAPWGFVEPAPTLRSG